MHRVVTKDETLVYRFDPEAKKQSMQWKHPDSPLLRNQHFSSREGEGLYLFLIVTLSWWIILRKVTRYRVAR